MNILHKIEQLMQTNHIKNKRQLSELSGIPYSTIAGFYTKGYDKMKLSTLKSLANFFNVSIDYLGRDEIVDPDYGKFILKPASTDYSPDEQNVISGALRKYSLNLFYYILGDIAMKKRVLIALLLISLFAVSASAHGGRTDANGGHHDYQNKSGLGSYHYHHGYPAHLHPGGVCPYNSAASSAGTDGAATISDRYKEGYGDGYDAGYAEGYNVGQTDAQESFKSEKQSAVNSAYKEGKADGYAGRDRVYTHHTLSTL